MAVRTAARSSSADAALIELRPSICGLATICGQQACRHACSQQQASAASMPTWCLSARLARTRDATILAALLPAHTNDRAGRRQAIGAQQRRRRDDAAAWKHVPCARRRLRHRRGTRRRHRRGARSPLAACMAASLLPADGHWQSPQMLGRSSMRAASADDERAAVRTATRVVLRQPARCDRERGRRARHTHRRQARCGPGRRRLRRHTAHDGQRPRARRDYASRRRLRLAESARARRVRRGDEGQTRARADAAFAGFGETNGALKLL